MSFSVFLLVACSHDSQISPTIPLIEDSDSCAAACENLSQLGCDEAKPVAAGVQCVSSIDCRPGDTCINRVCHASCENFCKDTQSWGVWLHPRCVVDIKTCDQVDSCSMSDY